MEEKTPEHEIHVSNSCLGGKYSIKVKGRLAPARGISNESEYTEANTVKQAWPRLSGWFSYTVTKAAFEKLSATRKTVRECLLD